jgi:hypothetical protein
LVLTINTGKDPASMADDTISQGDNILAFPASTEANLDLAQTVYRLAELLDHHDQTERVAVANRLLRHVGFQ